jgi:hypothetical protein
MEIQAIVKRALFFLSGPRVAELDGSFGQADKIRDSFRSFLLEQPDDDGAERRIEHCVRSWGARQIILLGIEDRDRPALSRTRTFAASVRGARAGLPGARPMLNLIVAHPIKMRGPRTDNLRKGIPWPKK